MLVKAIRKNAIIAGGTIYQDTRLRIIGYSEGREVIGKAGNKGSAVGIVEEADVGNYAGVGIEQIDTMGIVGDGWAVADGNIRKRAVEQDAGSRATRPIVGDTKSIAAKINIRNRNLDAGGTRYRSRGIGSTRQIGAHIVNSSAYQNRTAVYGHILQ